MSDQVEQNLKHIAERLQSAWTTSQCLTCPLGELAALAAATLTFYQEHTKHQRAGPYHWADHWTNYREIK